jgi:hypothetical protein
VAKAAAAAAAEAQESIDAIAASCWQEPKPTINFREECMFVEDTATCVEGAAAFNKGA